MTGARLVILLFAAAALAACKETPQTSANSAKKSDAPAYHGVQNPHVAAGWNAGDSGSWEEQMRIRVRNQNEYVRAQ